ncbi:hypothetical protein [Geofilum rubicundum]|uniref:Uncharacterized protein n=1 Tax=Geofilum rubicundum JCM 15548 TaxID=1236989 RepID=A0A0E9LS28_9BACT|nr:hypothetical protein [Geofilum rubicundum]GAO27941.1 hypothetical protein JCM15548_14823 [Geofilum rubicundum JCM 15548]
MTKIRKQFYRKLLFIGIGIIPIVVFFSSKGPERFAALTGFLFIIWNFIKIITQIQPIVDDFFPPKSYDRKSSTSFDKVIYIISMIIFFVGLLSQIFVLRRIDNTIDGLNLYLISGFVGMVLAFVIILTLKSYSPTIYDESNRRLSIIMSLIIGLFLLFPALACVVNESSSESEILNEKYLVINKGSSSTKNKEHYLYLNIKGDNQRVTVSKSFWQNVEEGKTISLSTKKGLFGFRYIIEFKMI